jgi:hypothetical protein
MRLDNARQSSTAIYVEVKEKISKYIYEDQKISITEIIAPEMDLK